MRRIPTTLCTAAACALVLASHAAESTTLTAARTALNEGIPDVGIFKLNAALADKQFPASERTAALRLLAECQLSANLPADALKTLETLEDKNDIAATMLRAHAYAATGRWEEALPIYQKLNGLPETTPTAAVGEAECLQALGRTAEAAATLERLLAGGPQSPSARLRLASLMVELNRPAEARELTRNTDTVHIADDNWRRYIEARIHLLGRDKDAALKILTPMLEAEAGKPPKGLSQSLFAAVTLAFAEAHFDKDNPDPAQKILEAFIRANPESPQLELVFRRLDQFYEAEKNAAEKTLHDFYDNLPPRAAALAKFYVARMQIREKDYAKAAISLSQFLEKFPTHPLIPDAHAMRADLALSAITPANAKESLEAAANALEAASRTARTEDQRAGFELRTALVNLQQGEFLLAANRMMTAKENSALRKTAMFNSALAWLFQRNHTRFAEELKAFAADFAAPLLVGNLRLEQGLVKARAGEPDAAEVLLTFLKEFADHPRKPEAQVAYAELRFAAGNPEEAEAFVKAAATDQAAAPETVERAEYLAIFLEDSKRPRDVAKVIRIARDFTKTHPTSPLLPEVRMKLGQVYFNADDFLLAQEQFEKIADEDPSGPFSETALFLAGQCAMKLMNTQALNRGLELFNKVAERKGSLAPHARLQQAIIKNKLGDESDAIAVYDDILSATTPAPLDVRYAALIGKGDNLVSLAQQTEPPPEPAVREKALTRAIASYDELLALPDLSPEWRNQAAYKRAKSLLQLGRSVEALSAFVDILNLNAAGPREEFWYAKAGFDAAVVLEERKDWRGAVGIYEKMAKVPGPHSARALERVKTLRLEHFLWD